MRRRSPSVDIGEAERPAQRRKLVEADFGEPDVFLVSEDGVQFEGHKNVLSVTCGKFASLLAETVKTEDQDDPLPRVKIPASAATIENILPAAYRRPRNHLRSKPYPELAAAIELAHTLDMSTSLELLVVYLEAHTTGDSAVELYMLAHRLNLKALQAQAETAMLTHFDLAQPLKYADLLGTDASLALHQKRLLAVAAVHTATEKDVRRLQQEVFRNAAPPGHKDSHEKVMVALLALISALSSATIIKAAPRLLNDPALETWQSDVKQRSDKLDRELKAMPASTKVCPVCKIVKDIVKAARAGHKSLFPSNPE